MFDCIWAVALGFLLDAFFGDPHWLPHPVRLIGWLISRIEPFLRRVFPDTPKGRRMAGAVLALMVPVVCAAAAWLLLWGAGQINHWLAVCLQALMCYQLIAAKDLCTESMRVYDALNAACLPAARRAVSMIVGRDTEDLTQSGVIKAAVETVAENASDGVIAPLFFLALGGAPLGFFYKAVNTLDSMVGYRNERYIDFGRWSARLDDLLNWFPARVSALLMIAAAAPLGLDARCAARIWRRDRRKHASPNSAQTEAACAGALGVCLAGDAYYGGVLHQKPTIGDSIRPVCAQDIMCACRLMYGASVLALVLFLGIRLAAVILL
ncbi:adenosylcobinamide-phosphate synthase CbiB [Anaerotruncus colihominis]|uniref:adenosylcobinamide-phosphate synthase CbiB n=1 Tax=Anaerotruncus colihominis TaxID=169435 RepID=UPI0026F0C83B|nr:adenosylcobinamide-phosphate synthase CbiB [Anaerotruncus colihominis]